MAVLSVRVPVKSERVMVDVAGRFTLATKVRLRTLYSGKSTVGASDVCRSVTLAIAAVNTQTPVAVSLEKCAFGVHKHEAEEIDPAGDSECAVHGLQVD